jgi:hypothetical protein
VTVSLLRLYLLRLAYLILVVGIGVEFWPGLIQHGAEWPVMRSTVFSMLAALSILAAFGLRYPLAMLPALFFEILWKALWLTLVALPKWLAGKMDAATMESVFACALIVIVVPLIPWRYAAASYLMKPGDRWR